MKKTEILIGNVLRSGVIISASVVFLGGVIYLFRHGLSPIDYKTFHAGPLDLRTVIGILMNAFLGHGRGFIQLGLLLLIATPITRVALSILLFARQKDKLYVVITLIVFCILTWSLLGR